MDIITQLKDDHARAKAIFERLEVTTARANKTRSSLLASLEQELRLHMRFEEEILYPAIKANADEATRDLALEAYAEHQAAREALDKLVALEPSDDMWKAWATVLEEELDHHIEEEETELFVRARELIAPRELQAMGDDYRRWKIVAMRERRELAASEHHHPPLVGWH